MGWTREQLEQALQRLDQDIAPMRERCGDMDAFWSEFDRRARLIQREADADIWYAAAQLDHMLIRHGLMPRPGIHVLPRRRMPYEQGARLGAGEARVA